MTTLGSTKFEGALPGAPFFFQKSNPVQIHFLFLIFKKNILNLKFH